MSVGKKILIVEDEEILADNISTYLQRASCEVRVAGSARQAMGMLDDFVPEVVILDYHLPGANGFQTLDAIRNRSCACGFILITGHPTDEVHVGIRERGIREVLFKPFPLHELAEALSRGGQLAPVVHATPVPDGPVATANERRNGERRRIGVEFFLPFRLASGSWLFTDRRRAERRDDDPSGD